MAQKIMGWVGEADIGTSSRSENPYTAEQSKAISAKLGLDNINFLFRAPTYAHSHAGVDGRRFVGAGMIKSADDLAMIKLPDPHNDSLYDEAAEFVAAKEDYAACWVTRIGFFQVVLGLGIEGFSLALYDQPDLIRRMLDMYFDWMEVAVEKMSKIGFDLFWSTDDFAHKTGLMFAPPVFHDLLAPYYHRIADKLTIPWVLHSDGDITAVMDFFLDMGVNGFHPIEKGAMDIVRVKQNYGDRACLLGNLDLNILGAGTPEDVEAEVEYLIKAAGEGGGYIVTSGNSLASYLKPECVLAIGPAVAKHGRYPLR